MTRILFCIWIHYLAYETLSGSQGKLVMCRAQRKQTYFTYMQISHKYLFNNSKHVINNNRGVAELNNGKTGGMLVLVLL